jgi:hypothetical protein
MLPGPGISMSRRARQAPAPGETRSLFKTCFVWPLYIRAAERGHTICLLGC